MKHVIAVGMHTCQPHVESLLSLEGCCVTLLNDADLLPHCLALNAGPERQLVVVVNLLGRHAALTTQLQGLKARGFFWLGITPGTDPALAQLAYQWGASAAIPTEVKSEIIRELVARLFEQQKKTQVEAPRSARPRLRHYRPGERIYLPADHFLFLRDGIVSLSVLDAEGDERILGFATAGELLGFLDDQSISLSLFAHKQVAVRVLSWSDVVHDPDCLRALRKRLEAMAVWALAQTESSVEGRLLKALISLGKQAGVQSSQGSLLDFRLTHAQLASAIGATRSTVTRSIGRLRAQGMIHIASMPDGVERIRLPSVLDD